MTHDLKSWPEPFRAVREGRKVHEVRRADRRFSVGDLLRLREWSPHLLTGGGVGGDYTRAFPVVAEVLHVTAPGTWGLPADLVVLSIRVVHRSGNRAGRGG